MMTRTERRVQRKPDRSIWKITLLALIVLFATAAASYYWFTHSSLPTPKKHKRAVTNQYMPEQSGKVNILVLGVDERADDVGRSDTMFVVTIDTGTKETSLLSVPRDTRVKIPGYGWDKINHAYPLGGQQLSQRALEELLGIPIDYYVKINFAGFYKIVDALGGVDIDVEKRMYYEDPYDDLVIDLKPGQQHMDGKTAIKYVRYRDEEGDIGRIGRQQKFIKAMLEEATSPGIVIRLPSVISEIADTVETDLSVGEMLGLGKILNDAKAKGLKTDMIAGSPIFIEGINYWIPDIVALREYIARTQGFRADEKYLSSARRMADEYKNALPEEASSEPDPKAEGLKPGTVPGKTAPAEKAAEPAKSANPEKPAKPLKPQGTPDRIRVEVVNASGSNAAAEKMAAALRQQGFEVSRITQSGSVNRNTLVISHSSQGAVLNRVTNLPFNYVLQVTPDSARTAQVTVIVGRDFAK